MVCYDPQEKICLEKSHHFICSPWVVLSDFGGAFAMGAIGGGIWHGVKGARNSPRVGHSPQSNMPGDLFLLPRRL